MTNTTITNPQNTDIFDMFRFSSYGVLLFYFAAMNLSNGEAFIQLMFGAQMLEWRPVSRTDRPVDRLFLPTRLSSVLHKDDASAGGSCRVIRHALGIQRPESAQGCRQFRRWASAGARTEQSVTVGHRLLRLISRLSLEAGVRLSPGGGTGMARPCRLETVRLQV